MGVSLLSWSVLAGFALISAALYASTLGYPFHFDGQPYVIQNPLIRDIGNFGSYFAFAGHYRTVSDHELPADLATNFILRPLTYLSFWVNYALGGTDPRGYRAVNIAIHATNGWLVFLLLRRLMQSHGLRRRTEAGSGLFVPLASALLYLVHPLQVESVTYIAQRFTSLATFFYLLTILLHFRSCDATGRRARELWRVASVAALIFGMLSKEICFTAPVMVVLLDMLVMGTAWRTALRRTLPLLACMPLIPWILLAAAHAMGNGHATLGDALRMASPECQGQQHFYYLLTEVRVVATYLGLVLLPQGLNIDWDFGWTHSLAEGRLYAAAILLLAVLGGGWWMGMRRGGDARHRLIFASVLWFFITLSVSSGLAPLPDALAEHRACLASIGILAAAVCLLDLLHTRCPPGSFVRWPSVVVALWITMLGAVTVRRNLDWKSNVTLWEDCVAKSPQNARGWENLGIAYLQENNSAEASACLGRALTLRPQDPEICKNLGASLVQERRYPEALNVCRAALQIPNNDDRAGLHYNMALACLALGQRDAAARHLRDALSISPKHFLANLCLAGFYADENKRAAALRHYQTAAVQYPEDRRLSAIWSRIERMAPTKGG
jgi:tetratricopeptide (TPR) repeat protein